MRPLILALLLAQAPFRPPSSGPGTNAPFAGGAATDLEWDATTYGTLIEEPGAVANVVWNGSSLVDLKGNAWTEVGAVPQFAGDEMLPGLAAAGPMQKSVNYYRTTGNSDFGDFAGSFWCAAVWSGDPVSNAPYLINEGGGVATSGWHMRWLSGGALTMYVCDGTSCALTAMTASGPTQSKMPHIGFVGIDTSTSPHTAWAALDMGAPASGQKNYAPASDNPLYLACHDPALGGSSCLGGKLYQVLCVPEAPNTAKWARIAARFFGLLSKRPPAAAMPWTRNSAQACVGSTGLVWYAPPNTPCVVNGQFIHRSAFTEKFLHTNDIVSGTSPVAPWAVQNGVVAAPGLSVVSAAGPTGVTGSVARVVFPAIAGDTNYSVLFQGISTSAGPYSWDLFYLADGPDCTFYVSNQQAGTARAVGATSVWNRATLTVTPGAGTIYFVIGPDGRAAFNGGQPNTQAACTVLLYEANATNTSIAMPPTTATTATVDVPNNVATSTTGMTLVPTNGGCVAARFTPRANAGANCRVFGFNTASDASPMFLNGDNAVSFWDGTGVRINQAWITMGQEANLTSCWRGGVSTMRNNLTGAVASGTFSQDSVGSNIIGLGTNPVGYYSCDADFASIKVCRNTSDPLRCQP